MPEEHDQQALLVMLSNVQRDTGQIKNDLAVNTTKTGYIEDHLRTLNGKVVKQEERLQAVEKSSEGLVNTKKTWTDGFSGVFKYIFGVLSTLISAFIINKYF
jgi:hypothetical protein